MRIYQYLKTRTNRSRSEHILFSEMVIIIDWLNPTERAALMATRETKSRQKPDPPSSKEIAEFTEMREAFLNKSPKRLPPTTDADPPHPKRNCIPSAPSLSADGVEHISVPGMVHVDLEVIPDKGSLGNSQNANRELFETVSLAWTPYPFPTPIAEVETEIFMEEYPPLEVSHDGERRTMQVGKALAALGYVAPIRNAFKNISSFASYLQYPYTGFEKVIEKAQQLARSREQPAGVSGRFPTVTSDIIPKPASQAALDFACPSPPTLSPPTPPTPALPVHSECAISFNIIYKPLQQRTYLS